MPNNTNYMLGLHIFTAYGGILAVDGLGIRIPFDVSSTV